MNKENPLSVDLPEGVAQIVIHEGEVLVQVAPELAETGLGLSVGGSQVRLEPIGEVGGTDLDLLSDFRPAFDAGALVAEQDDEAAQGYEISLNGNKQWALPGAPTVQLKVTDPTSPCTVALAAPIVLPPHDKPLAFRAALAAHRATGHLEISRVRTAGNKPPKTVETVKLAFDADKIGGHDLSGYAQLDHVLAPMKTASELHLAIVYEEYRGGDTGRPAFLFVADPYVAPGTDEMPAGDGMVLRGPSDAGPSAKWLRAPLPGQPEPGAPLTLLAGDRRFVLLSGGQDEITLEEDHGHSLRFRASAPGRYRFVIDGTHVFTQPLGPDASWVRMPAQYQTGHARSLSILSEDGLNELFATYVLMPRLLTPMSVLQTESSAPFPGPLMSQASHRYAALSAQMEAGNSTAAQAQIAWALKVVEGGHENVKLKPLTFPKVKSPDVSIVIPAHNKVEVTYLALASLLLAHNAASFEVIVVDDASTDETTELEKIVSGITVIHNAQAQRFIRACNAGVAQARGQYVVLLNNDVEVTNGWLDALIDAFGRFDNVGLVGSKLLYPDGKLQDAGGIIWGTGNPWNYGNGQNPWEPRFSYARQADYLSGAAMMTTRDIWDEVGGLSSYLEPMYFEDTDFAFKIRDAGYSTWFVPSSVVYHYEGMTSGTDTSSGFKRYQEVNRPKFKRRWAADYAKFGPQGVEPDLEKDRGIVGRVLFIDYATPRPDRDAGSHAAIQEIKLVQSLGYKVTFLPRNMAHLGSYTEELERMGVEVIYAPFFLTMDEYLGKHAKDFDAFFITRFYVARDVIDRLRQLAPETKILFNNADLHFLRELRAGMAANDPAKIAAARQTRTLELDVMRKSDVVLSYNEVEHSVIQSHTDGEVLVAKCPWVVEMPETVPGLKGRSGMSFLGNYLHAPNAEAVIWFARQVMPRLSTDQDFVIYGSAMSDEIKALASDRIRPEGFVETLSDAYDRHRVFVAPLLSGAGIKGKVLAALAHGIPCVLTPTAAEGIGVRHNHDCLIATTPVEWQEAIDRLMTDDALWQSISDNASGYVRQTFSFETGRDLMRAAFESVDLYSPVR